MDFIHYFSSNHASLLFLIAGITLVLELAVMGLSGLLLFFSIGCFITATLTHFGIISGWESEVFSVGIFTILTALLLWKPLKRFQEKGVPQDNSSDMTGREVPCAESISKTQGAIRYSGINWPARLDASANVDIINEGDMCVIVNVDGNIMLVEAVR
jgi:membrane protein implicated in regulation of membrane protease activity